MAHHYLTIGRCIYCGETKLPPNVKKFGSEHIIPFSLGGVLILPEASCRKCEKIINNEVENVVCGDSLRYFRARFKIPTRNPKKRSTHVPVRTLSGGKLKIPIAEHSTPVMQYLFWEARALSGLSNIPNEKAWKVNILTSHDLEMQMKEKFPTWDQKHSLVPRPYQYARFLAKIAHGLAVAELGLDTFIPWTTEIIRGISKDYFYTVGGLPEIEPPVPDGKHMFNIHMKFIDPTKALVIVDLRLFASVETPSYHVVVGQIDLQNPLHAAAFEKHRLDGRLEILLEPNDAIPTVTPRQST